MIPSVGEHPRRPPTALAFAIAFRIGTHVTGAGIAPTYCAGASHGGVAIGRIAPRPLVGAVV